jgi:hypothetical protein
MFLLTTIENMLLRVFFFILLPLLILCDNNNSTTKTRSYNELMACFDILPNNVSHFGYTPIECMSASDPKVILSVLISMMDKESMQILTFSSYSNFNLFKTRVMLGTVNENNTVIEYIGFETTTRFEKKGKMIVLSRSVVKGKNDTSEKTDTSRRIKLIASRKHKEYIFHIYDMQVMNISDPEVDLLHQKSVVRISMDAQESATNNKQQFVAISEPEFLFGRNPVNESMFFDDEGITEESHSGISLAPFLVAAVIIFFMVLIFSCHIGIHSGKPVPKKPADKKPVTKKSK